MIRPRFWSYVAAALVTFSASAVVASLPAMATEAPAGLPELAAALLPAVVNISTDKMAKPGADPNAPRRRESLGSGFIIDPAGIIVTNNHVIAGAYEITVKLQDRTALKATVTAASSIADVAVLRVNFGKPLPTVKFSNDENIEVGDPVVAIGNPLGMGGSVTTGIISALNRNIQLSPYDDFIQTDAAINHGNSGGPLFNMRGEVIGMNTAIYSGDASGGSIGIGFSMPARNVKFVVGELRLYGRVRPGWLALQAQDVTQDIVDSLALPEFSGAIVTNLVPGGSGEVAGIHPGDVILKIGSHPVGDLQALMREVGVLPLGSQTKVGIWRDRKPMDVTAVVQEWTVPGGNPSTPAGTMVAEHTRTEDRQDLGLQLGELTDYARGKYNLDPHQQGVLVAGVAPNSVADDRGLVAGDVIMTVQTQAVHSVEEARQRVDGLRQQGEHSVLTLISGREGLRWIAFPLQLNQPSAAPAAPMTPGAPAALTR